MNLLGVRYMMLKQSMKILFISMLIMLILISNDINGTFKGNFTQMIFNVYLTKSCSSANQASRLYDNVKN